ncbi:MAG: diguanylate cyclase [Phycisphaerales bacterium]|nr:diguanylate cyclase [Phycisphaerales bacterium]
MSANGGPIVVGDGLDILIIDDDPTERALLVQRLARQQYQVAHAATGAEGLRAVYQYRPRIVICDVLLPDMEGIDICQRVRADPTLDGVYIIIITAYDSGRKKQRALAAGADDYLAKPYDPNELRARIRNGLRFHRLQERLQRVALTDGLTDLWNHHQFRELLDKEYQRVRRYGGALSLLMVDLDHFKSINDTYGHEVGNQVLRQTARQLLRAVRDTDYVARYGGEEFAIICPETSLDDAAFLGERIRLAIHKNVRVETCADLAVFTSVGAASASDPRVGSVGNLIDLADQALYESKRNGRNRVTRADQIGERSEAPVRLDEVDRLRKEIHSLSLRTKELCLQSVWALIQALEARDPFTAWHSRNVTLYATWALERVDWGAALRKATINAAMLHNLGKIGIPDALLLKSDELTPEELATIRQAPLITCKILEPLRVFETEIAIIRHLRERFDGAGYPDGLVGASAPIGSRLLSVIEAFDSMTGSRTYRTGIPIEDALVELERESGSQFDPDFVRLVVQTVQEDRARWQAQILRARKGCAAARCEVERVTRNSAP